MRYLAVIAAVIVVNVAGSWATPDLNPRKANCGGINIAVRENLAPEPSAVVDSPSFKNCNEIVDIERAEYTEYTCLLTLQADARSSGSANPGSLTMNATTMSASGADCDGVFVCNSAVRPPNLNDAKTLCSIISGDHTVNAVNNGCVCVSASYGSATYMMCNCNACSTLVFTNIGSDCEAILSCMQSGDWGEYHMFTNVNAYMILFLAGSNPPQPVPFRSCGH